VNWDFRAGNISRQASAVWDRSPPPSCSSTTEPGRVCLATYSAMTSAPGRL